MTLAERIEADLTAAMKASEEPRVSTLRMLKAELANAAIAARQPRVADPQALEIIQRQITQRRESVAAFTKGSRQDLVDQESRELAILQTYLPAQLSDDALRALVEEAVQASGAAGPQGIGPVMKRVMAKVQGQADGQRVSAMVAARLAKPASHG